MKSKLLTSTLLSMVVLSLNLSAQNKMKCTGKYCIVDISDVKKKPESSKVIEKEPYTTVIIDNIETIVFADEKYKMTDDELAEYELQNSLYELTNPVLTEDGLPIPEQFCEDNLTPVKVVGVANTFECA